MLVQALCDFELDGLSFARGDSLRVDAMRARRLQQKKLVTAHPPQRHAPQAPSWFPKWQGQPCVIVASGPSAPDVPLEAGRDRARFLAINNSWKLAPWADALYATDFAWWSQHAGVPQFAGLKISQDPKLIYQPGWGIKRVMVSRQDRMILDNPGVIGWGGNSGFGALNLAVQFGARTIMLVGYDMRVDHGLHWHGPHPAGMHNPSAPNVERWRRAIDDAAPILTAAGVTILNCSAVSALRNYPKIGFDEALALESAQHERDGRTIPRRRNE